MRDPMDHAKRCEPCDRQWLSWSEFGKHMTRTHEVDREAFWRRANQVGDSPCTAVRTDRGHWLLMVQGRLSL